MKNPFYPDVSDDTFVRLILKIIKKNENESVFFIEDLNILFNPTRLEIWIVVFNKDSNSFLKTLTDFQNNIQKDLDIYGIKTDIDIKILYQTVKRRKT
jgi:hypothetical protein